MNDNKNGAHGDTENAHSLTAKPAGKVHLKRLDDVQINDLELVIADAPPPPKKLTTADAMRALTPRLRDAVARGHTTDSLTNLLNSQGLHVTARAVAHALRHNTTPLAHGSVRQSKRNRTD